MNILTIGLRNAVTEIFTKLIIETCNHVLHIYEKDRALQEIKNNNINWDWIIIQGHDNPEHWSSILCAVNANANNTPITVLSSHIDGTSLKTPVCSMHKNTDTNEMTISRCAMHNLLNDDIIPVMPKNDLNIVSPVIFEYHAPCR